MKRTYCAILILGLCGCLLLGWAQPSIILAEQELPAIDELRVPNSPAFNLLGISPSVIDRPATPKALGISLLEASSKSEGNFPRNIALEVAPYWWTSHPELTFEDYYSKTGFGESILQTLAISIGTTETTLQLNGADVKGTRLGLGFKFNLVSGKANPALAGKVKELKDLQLEVLANIPDTGEVADSPLTRKLSAKAKEIANLDKARVGWQVEFASGATYDLPNDDWDDSELTRYGGWLTASYHSPDVDSVMHQLTFLALGRYIYEDINGQDDNIFDTGASIFWKSREMPVSLSAEYIHRFSENDDQDRLVGVLEYIVNETYSVFASYGKTFESDFEGDDNLVAILGINFGWGKGPIIK
jgi:hypothetical protein